MAHPCELHVPAMLVPAHEHTCDWCGCVWGCFVDRGCAEIAERTCGRCAEPSATAGGSQPPPALPQRDLCRRVVACLTEAGMWLTARTIAARIQARHASVGNALLRLLAQQRVQRTWDGQRYRYRLVRRPARRQGSPRGA